MSKLGRKKVFSVIDLRQGFWQIPCEKDSRKYLAFKTPSGLFQWKVMPFGLKTAPALFTKAIRRMLSAKYGDVTLKERLGPGAPETLNTDPYAFAYMDDIVIFSDDEESHTQHVLDIMRRLKEFGLKVSAEKTHLFKKEVKYLGHIIGRFGTKMNLDKVDIINQWELPQTPPGLLSFVPTVGFYKNFLGEKFVQLAKPLREMINSGNMKWTAKNIQKFKLIKEMITSETVLASPDWSKEFFLETDASSYAVGGVCYQYDEKQNKRPIMWMGRKLNKNEANYCTRDQELLAVLYCIERARMYLYGRHFTVKTDHLNLLWLYENDVQGRIARWATKLFAYDFTIKHIRGKDNIVADGISRMRGATAVVMSLTTDNTEAMRTT